MQEHNVGLPFKIVFKISNKESISIASNALKLDTQMEVKILKRYLRSKYHILYE